VTSLLPGEGRRQSGYGFHYSLPWGFWCLSAGFERQAFNQALAGRNATLDYQGYASNARVELSRVIHRTSHSRSSLGLALFVATAHHQLNQVELELQRRRQAGWEILFNHRQYLGRLVVDGGVSYHQGTGALGSQASPAAPGWPAFLALNLRLVAPFSLGGENFRWLGVWRSQLATKRLARFDQLAIGGRYSVRGFSGDLSLAGEGGEVVRNELGWFPGAGSQEFYLGVDFGQVRGPSTVLLAGQQLAGAALGLRGAWHNLEYDFFLATPLYHPASFAGRRLVPGFNLSLAF
jgi:hemolysin activation/secretion protein